MAETNSQWKIAWFALAVLGLMVLWGWSENGRYRFATEKRDLLIDTRTGDVYYSSEKLIRVSKEDSSPR